MAEATTEVRTNESKFYCHQCKKETSPKLPEFLCPTCNGGFIEEITDEFSGNDTAEEGAQTVRNPFSILHGPLFGGMDEQDLDSSEDDDFLEGAASPSALPLGRGPIPGARISVRTIGPGAADGQQALQGLLEQLLTSLTGAGRGGNVIFSMNQGPLGLFNMGGLAGNPGDYAWGPGGLDAIITQLMNQLEGTGPPPAPAEKIDSLPTVSINKEHVDKKTQCSVCFEEFKLEEEVRQLPCQHLYHTDCIKPWLRMHGTCPVCRKTLEGEDTSCDENTQSIPETLEHMGLDTSTMSPRQDSSSQAQQAAVNGSTSSPSRHPNRTNTRGGQTQPRDNLEEFD